MIAQRIVEILTGEDPFDGKMPAGILGVVEYTEGNIRAKPGELDYVEHKELGWKFSDARWRFATNRRIPVVAWSNSPSPIQMRAVEEWLATKGYKVASHTEDLVKWRWG